MPATNPEQTHHRAAQQAAQRHPASVSAKPPYDAATSAQAVYGPALPPTLWLFPVAVLGGFVLLAALIARFKKRVPKRVPTPFVPNYTTKNMLTPTELHFWRSLRLVAEPRAHVLMKVRLADVLLAPPGDLRAFRKVSQKHVDFLLCHPETLKPLVAVELDDSSHLRARTRARDEFVNQAYQSVGLPIVHVPVTGRYDARELEALLGRHLPAGPV